MTTNTKEDYHIMVQLIVGHKGSGKTKTVVELANKAVKESRGNVVVVEKDIRLTYEISSQARLVYSDEYGVLGYEAIYGFITGILAGNYDITHLFVDPIFKMCGRDFEAFTQMVNKLNNLPSTRDVTIVFTVSCEPEDLPFHLRDMMIN